jgi:hypothetical protein
MFSFSKKLTPKKKEKAGDAVMTSPISSVQTIGKGEIEKDHQSIFSFQTFGPSGWGATTATKHQSTITDELSSEDDDEEEQVDATDGVKIDTTTDLAYHSKEEYVKCQEIVQNLTHEELKALPDPLMPLRHYRAEKVRTSLGVCCCVHVLSESFVALVFTHCFFLMFSKGDIAKTIDAIKHSLQWRKEFEVDKIIHAFDTKKDSSNDDDEEEDMAAILLKENETGKIYTRLVTTVLVS